ncbi:hypothetical protein SEUCBS139899_002130 [Sporothrix eucalyptigena]
MATNGTNGTNGHTNGHTNGNGTVAPYRYSRTYLRKARPLRIAIIGCGVSGIAAVHMFKERFRAPGQDLPIELVIYEKNKSIGGTWYENRYPGCSCDVPSHSYTFSWDGNPYFSRVYVGAPELYDYFTDRAEAYGVPEFVKLEHQVESAMWDNAKGQYAIVVKDLATGNLVEDTAEVVINASGVLNSWKWPDFPGLETFEGKLLHSANYDTSADLSGKTVGVVGTGSSGIQLVPQVQAVAKHMHTFHRSATFVTPELALEMAPKGRDTVYSEEQQQEWATNPEEFLKMRKKATHILNTGFEVIYKDSDAQKQMLEKIKEQMRARLAKKPELIPALIPDFALGCRRFTPGDGYLEALCADNVSVHTQGVRQVQPTGMILQDGTAVSLDVLVCATGFNTSFVPPFRLTGLDGAVLNEVWKQNGPQAYMGVAAAGFPNYFMTTGPNCPAAHGTFIPCIEAYLNYAFSAAERLMTEDIKSITVKQAAVDDFQAHKDDIVQDLVWTSGCRSWYKNGTVDGKVWGPWPGSGPHFVESITVPRWEDYDFVYRSGNRFQYLGDGRTLRELQGGDLSWFIKPQERTEYTRPKQRSAANGHLVDGGCSNHTH